MDRVDKSMRFLFIPFVCLTRVISDEMHLPLYIRPLLCTACLRWQPVPASIIEDKDDR